MYFLQGKSSRKLQAHVPQRVKHHCMALLSVSFQRDLVPVVENRAQHTRAHYILLSAVLEN